MNIYQIKYEAYGHTVVSHIDLDHILMIDEPTTYSSNSYGFSIWLAFRDKPVIIQVYRYSEGSYPEIDEAYNNLLNAWKERK